MKRELKALIKEYIEECEHQDGSGYWKQFNKLSDLVEDIARYQKAKEPRFYTSPYYDEYAEQSGFGVWDGVLNDWADDETRTKEEADAKAEELNKINPPL
jgi:hypothetical protein